MTHPKRGEATVRLTKAQMKLLRQYAHTTDGNFMQGLPGTTKLWRPLGLLDWRGDSYGCHFFSITPAGRAILNRAGAGQ